MKVKGFWRSATASGMETRRPSGDGRRKKAVGGSGAQVEVRLTLAAILPSTRKRGEGLQLFNGTLYLGRR